jgi:NADH dehydrogenase
MVTGATGFVGRAVVGHVHHNGHEVRILARRPDASSARELARAHGAEAVAGDVLEPDSLPPALNGIDAVIHLVGIISEIGRQTFERVHTEGTRHLLVAAKEVGVKRYVQMSALGSRPNAVSRYHRSKWAAEELVRSSGLEWTIFRPSIIYGPEDHLVNLFATMARWFPVLPVLGSGRSTLQPVHVEAVAHCFAAALTEPAAVGKVFDLCGPERFSLNELLDTLLEVMGRHRWKAHVPLPIARLQAALLEWVYPVVFRMAAPLNRDQLIMLQEDNVGDAKPARELFRPPERNFREAIGEYL